MTDHPDLAALTADECDKHADSAITSNEGAAVYATLAHLLRADEALAARVAAMETPAVKESLTSGGGGEGLEHHDPISDGEMGIDPGIRRHVLLLRAAGIETFESCEGGAGHAFPEPTIRFHGNAYEGHRAFSIAMTHGLPVLEVRRQYPAHDGELHGPNWAIVFREKDSVPEQRAADSDSSREALGKLLHDTYEANLPHHIPGDWNGSGMQHRHACCEAAEALHRRGAEDERARAKPCEHESALVKGALDAQAEAERRMFDLRARLTAGVEQEAQNLDALCEALGAVKENGAPKPLAWPEIITEAAATRADRDTWKGRAESTHAEAERLRDLVGWARADRDRLAAEVERMQGTIDSLRAELAAERETPTAPLRKWRRLRDWGGREQWTLCDDDHEFQEGVVWSIADEVWLSFHLPRHNPFSTRAAALTDAEELLGVRGDRSAIEAARDVARANGA